MATANYFVSATNGNDANDGLDNIGVGLATATWTAATYTLTQAGHGYTYSAGDVIAITGGTGATAGLYQVASSTANTIVLEATATIPRCSDGGDLAAGDLGAGDITSSDGPWQTIDNAMNNVLAADDTHVFVRNEATYVESPSIDTAVTYGRQTCAFEGYGTTPGDDTQITIQGQLVDSIATHIHYAFKNIIFDANGAVANCVNISSYELCFRKCKFVNATGNGFQGVQAAWFWDCDFEDNGGDGAICGAMGAFFNCRFYRNTLSAIDCSSTLLCWNCTFFSNGALAMDGGASNETHVIAINCTVDGDSKDTITGVNKSIAFRGMVAVINTIIYDCANGENSIHRERSLLLYNLFNSNITDHVNTGEDQEGTFVTDAPDFVNEVAGADYTLNSGSPAVSAGHDAANNMDIGSHQRTAAAGGGGLLGVNKRGNKQ